MVPLVILHPLQYERKSCGIGLSEMHPYFINGLISSSLF